MTMTLKAKGMKEIKMETLCVRICRKFRMHWQQAGQLFNFIYTLSHLFISLTGLSVVVDAMYEVMLIILNINDKRKENFYQYALATFAFH